MAARQAQQKKQLKLVGAPSETTGSLVQAVVDLHKAVKSAAFYPQGHPYRSETLGRAFQALCGLLAERELVLTVNRQGIMLGGEQAERNPMLLQFANECLMRRIASIVFMQDLLLGDLELFVQMLATDSRSASLGGFAKQLEDSGASTIWINEKDIAALLAKRRRPGSGERVGTGAGTGTGAGADEGWGAIVSPGLATALTAATVLTAATAATAEVAELPDVSELLRLMELERVDARYQELGRELVARIKDNPDDAEIVPVLEQLLRHHLDPQRSLPQKEYALFTLEHLADGAADLLLGALESRDYPNKEGIYRVLAALGGKGAYWIIQRISLAEGLYERKALATALIRLGPPALEPLVGMLKDQRWYVARNMVSIIGELRLPEGVVALKRSLHHEDVRVRKEAIRALTKIGGEAAETLLIHLLEERDQGLIRHAILSLGLMRSREAVPALLKLLERRDLLLKDLVVKKELLVALGRIGDRRASGQLQKMLGSGGWQVLGRWLELRVAVASALGALGDEASIASLSRFAAGSGALAEACREALDAMESVSGGNND